MDPPPKGFVPMINSSRAGYNSSGTAHPHRGPRTSHHGLTRKLPERNAGNYHDAPRPP